MASSKRKPPQPMSRCERSLSSWAWHSMTRVCCGRRGDFKLQICDLRFPAPLELISSLPLARMAIKRSPLDLNDSDDWRSASDAWLASSIIDAVMILVAAGLVERVSIGAIRQG